MSSTPERLLVDLSPAPPPHESAVRAWAAGQSVFVSSVIRDMGGERRAAAGAISKVGATPVLFEDFGGMDDDPEDAYLGNVAASDIYLGILGARYGAPLKTGYSATHAEYNEAVRRGLRVSVWNAKDGLDGPQRDFVDAVRVFHTTGSYASPDDLAAGVERRLRAIAAEVLAPWVKVGDAVLRATNVVDDGKTVTIKARIRDNTVAASLESRRPTQEYFSDTNTRFSWPGGTSRVRVTSVQIEVGAGGARTVTLAGERIGDDHSNRFDGGMNGLSPDDLVEVSLRVALFGEPNPLGSFGRMIEAENPLPALEGLGLSEDALAQVAELLLTELLVGDRGVDHITACQLGPKHHGRRRLLLAWMPRRRYSANPAVGRRIEGHVSAGA